jgi:hypothetical protein
MNASATSQGSIDMAVNMLRRLSFHDRLKVLSIVLPEIERECPPEESEQVQEKPESLYGLWQRLNFDVTKEDIAEIRQEMWQNFPREDIV